MKERTQWILWGAVGLCISTALYYAYFVQAINPYNHTAYGWLRHHWSTISNYSHGPLIPFIAGFLAWWNRDLLKKASVRQEPWGALVVGLSMLVYYIGVKGVQERVVIFSFVLLLYGLVLTLGGRGVYRALFFPITFLFLMIPLNFLDETVGFPLRQFVSQAATVLLNVIGIEAFRSGTGIHSSVFTFDVADPCSGIRSLMALTTITAAYAYVTESVWWKRWVLFVSAIPLAVLGNLGRVVAIALVAQIYGPNAADFFHKHVSGYILFMVALSAMIVEGHLLNVRLGRLLDYWLKPPSEIPS